MNKLGIDSEQILNKIGINSEKDWKRIGMKFEEIWERFGKSYLNSNVQTKINEKFYRKNFYN